MAKYDTSSIRNIALLGHSGSGKTSLNEAMLYFTGGTDRLGKTADGNTVSDYDAEEVKRGMSLSTSIAPVIRKNTKINVLDTPGYLDFVGEVKQALRVAGNAIIVIDAKSGVEVGTELAWDYAVETKTPKCFFINKIDDKEADYDKVFSELDAKFGASVCPVSVPCGEVIINLIENKAYKFDIKGHRSEVPMTDEYNAIVEKYQYALHEAIAMVSDEVAELFLEEQPVPQELIVEGIHEGIVTGKVTPVFAGSATKLWGIGSLLDTVCDSFASFTSGKGEVDTDGNKVKPDPAGAPAMLVFKTVADPFVGKMSIFKVMNGTVKKDMVMKNLATGSVEKLAHIYTLKGKTQTEVDELCCGDIGMIAKLNDTYTGNTLVESTGAEYAGITFPYPYMAMAMIPETAKDEGKISQALARMLEEDQTLKYVTDPDTKQMIISGIGDTHLSVFSAKLKARYGVSVKLEAPKIAYREKITKNVDIHARHKKQNGGSGQFGDVWIKFGPGEDPGLTFTVSVVGGVVPKNFNPAVEKGILEAMQKGVAGFPMTYLAADLHDGSYHPVDSDEVSFKTAAIMAYKMALEQAGPVLLEPTGELDITLPEAILGDVMGDLNKRRGSIMGMDAHETKKGYTILHAVVPKAEIADYPIALRAMSQGLASYTFKVTSYETVPGNIAQKIVEEYKKSQA